PTLPLSEPGHGPDGDRRTVAPGAAGPAAVHPGRSRRGQVAGCPAALSSARASQPETGGIQMTRMTDAASFRRPLLAALAALALGGPALAQAQGFGPPGPPPNAPPAEVPPQVAIPRPSAAEIEAARRAFADFVAKADANTRALLQKYPSLLEVRPPAPNTAIIPALSPQFRAKHEANLEVARQGDAELLFMGDSITDFWRN